MSWYEQLLVAGTLIPLIGFAVLVFFGARMGKPASGWFAAVAMGSSCLLATIVLVSWYGLDAADRADLVLNAARFHWASLGDVPVDVGVKLDSLTVIMFFMVTFVSSCIFVFSIGYMAGHSDEIDGRSKYHRFFTFLCLFGFSMLGLVISSSLLFLFIFWELVGLCSYFLIGFYFDKKFASNAAIKAFVTNRVGDFGFLLGLMMVFFFLNTLDLEQAAATFRSQYQAGSGIFQAGYTINLFGWHVTGMTLATVMGVALFCGAIGKSAQFPLHVWLPDAMAGPTPVSALIHAATMVAAGVYLVARIFRLLTPDAQFVVAVIGCITLTITALIAIVQTDIKKVLAYSTLSQLGYMIFGLGVGAWIAALFHLMTHAFFKAMLFLGSGQVIEGCHHEQDITRMGGLHKKMPFTCWTFFVGVLAIAGTGIPYTGIGVGGFYSKDEILAAALHRHEYWPPNLDDLHHDEHHSFAPERQSEPRYRLASDQPAEHGHQAGSVDRGLHAVGGADHPASVHDEHKHLVDQSLLTAIAAGTWSLPGWMFWLPIIIAYVTPFYMMRLWWLTFMGKPRDEHVYEHAHEMKLMYVPLVVLAIGTFLTGWFLFRPMIADTAPAAADAPLIISIDGHASETTHAAGLYMPHRIHLGLAPMVGFAFLVGFFAAWLIYRNGLGLARSIAEAPGIRYVHRALVQKLYFDHVYDYALVRGTIGLAWLSRLFDTYVVDLVFNLAAWITERVSALAGWVFDARGVDGVFNGAAWLSVKIGDRVRRPQTGRVRNYVLFTAGAAAVAIMAVIIGVWVVSSGGG